MTEPNQSTLPTNQIPEAWIDRLFARLAALYGKQWLDMWADVPMPDVKDAWRDSLSNVTGAAIRSALAHLSRNNKFPPSSPEFTALCKAFAPAYSSPALLQAPRSGEIDPRVRSEIAKALETGRKRDPKDWAREILELHTKGMYSIPGSIHGLACAKEALGIHQ